jgi:hypothetical protein
MTVFTQGVDFIAVVHNSEIYAQGSERYAQQHDDAVDSPPTLSMNLALAPVPRTVPTRFSGR